MILTTAQIAQRIAKAKSRIQATQAAADATNCPTLSLQRQQRVTRLAHHLGAHLARQHLSNLNPDYEHLRANRGR